MKSKSKKIEIQDELDLSKHCVEDQQQQNNNNSNNNYAKYKLYAILVHRGKSIREGHYIAYIRPGAANGDDQWYIFDDNFVTKCTDISKSNGNAYALIYIKISNIHDIPDCELPINAINSRASMQQLLEQQQQPPQNKKR